MKRILTILFSLLLFAGCAAPSTMVISVAGTNDVHGELLPREGDGGLVGISAYVEALRKARSEDGGAMILLDAGDMWQGTLESNMTEGATMIEAFNVLGYTAIAVGNHEFDFGPAGPLPIPESVGDDPRGALKQRAAEAGFPFLAANLIDEATGKPVQWPNFQPSIVIEVQGVKIGIIGVMTERALTRAIASNTIGLSIAPLVPTIEKEARRLRAAGASIILVSAHAGGGCTAFDNPSDTSSCKSESEIFSVANDLPRGLVDYILAGHTHDGIAHIVNGTPISESYSRAKALSRIDFTVDRNTGQVVSSTLFPPKLIGQEMSYEGQRLSPSPEILAIADKAAALAIDIKNEEIGIYLETPFERTEDPESAIGNLVTDALLASSGADVSMHRTNTMIRADLPAGELTMGSVYEMSPFDNQITVIQLSGAELRQVMAIQAHQGRFRVGFSGMRVTVTCDEAGRSVAMRLADGREILDTDSVSIAVADYLALGGDDVFTTVMPAGGYERQINAPLSRDAMIDWLQERGGTISASDFSSEHDPKWTVPDEFGPNCHP